MLFLVHLGAGSVFPENRFPFPQYSMYKKVMGIFGKLAVARFQKSPFSHIEAYPAILEWSSTVSFFMYKQKFERKNASFLHYELCAAI